MQLRSFARKGLLVRTGPIPNRGEPVLSATRHLQVEREWCPALVAAQADSVGQGRRMGRNTYQIEATPCAT